MSPTTLLGPDGASAKETTHHTAVANWLKHVRLVRTSLPRGLLRNAAAPGAPLPQPPNLHPPGGALPNWQWTQGADWTETELNGHSIHITISDDSQLTHSPAHPVDPITVDWTPRRLMTEKMNPQAQLATITRSEAPASLDPKTLLGMMTTILPQTGVGRGFERLTREWFGADEYRSDMQAIYAKLWLHWGLAALHEATGIPAGWVNPNPAPAGQDPAINDCVWDTQGAANIATFLDNAGRAFINGDLSIRLDYDITPADFALLQEMLWSDEPCIQSAANQPVFFLSGLVWPQMRINCFRRDATPLPVLVAAVPTANRIHGLIMRLARLRGELDDAVAGLHWLLPLMLGRGGAHDKPQNPNQFIYWPAHLSCLHLSLPRPFEIRWWQRFIGGDQDRLAQSNEFEHIEKTQSGELLLDCLVGSSWFAAAFFTSLKTLNLHCWPFSRLQEFNQGIANVFPPANQAMASLMTAPSNPLLCDPSCMVVRRRAPLISMSVASLIDMFAATPSPDFLWDFTIGGENNVGGAVAAGYVPAAEQVWALDVFPSVKEPMTIYPHIQHGKVPPSWGVPGSHNVADLGHEIYRNNAPWNGFIAVAQENLTAADTQTLKGVTFRPYSIQMVNAVQLATGVNFNLTFWSQNWGYLQLPNWQQGPGAIGAVVNPVYGLGHISQVTAFPTFRYDLQELRLVSITAPAPGILANIAALFMKRQETVGMGFSIIRPLPPADTPAAAPPLGADPGGTHSWF